MNGAAEISAASSPHHHHRSLWPTCINAHIFCVGLRGWRNPIAIDGRCSLL